MMSKAKGEILSDEWTLFQCTCIATNLLGLDSGLAAVSSIIVTEGSVVDWITVVVSHEWLYKRKLTNNQAKHKPKKEPPSFIKTL